MSKTTELSLLERVRTSSSGEGWQSFVAIYAPYIESWLRRLELPEEDVRDVCQDVMQVVVREIQHFEHNGRRGAFRSWLRLVMANRLRSFRRSQAKQPRTLDDSSYEDLAERLVDTNHDISRLWDEEHNRYVLLGLLRMVSARHEQKTILAFQRVFLEDRSADEVAEELGMTANAVRISQARVLRTLRELGEGLID